MKTTILPNIVLGLNIKILYNWIKQGHSETLNLIYKVLNQDMKFIISKKLFSKNNFPGTQDT